MSSEAVLSTHHAASAPPPHLPAPGAAVPAALERWALGMGMLVMYGPTAYELLNGGMWSTAEHGHGPLMLAVSLWLMWRRWNNGAREFAPAPSPKLAWPVLALGALLFISGRALQIPQFEVGSAIAMLAGCMALLGGTPLLKAMRFPLFFMIFMVPFPAFIIDPIGDVMKTGVSTSAENVLHALGYVVARTGVLLHVGQYHLLVADACAGMRTLLMLEAMGILYLNVVRHSSMLRNVGLALLIVPISFSANVIRVIVLALITYHWGDEAGQGFLHGFAGMVLFVSALALTIAADGLLRATERRNKLSLG